MKIMISAAIILTRITTILLRVLGSGGTSMPGKAAMFIRKHLLKDLAEDIKVIIITGTNGKTTTSRIISEILSTSGKTYFENKSGANLISGITASFALNCNLNGKPKCNYAVIECDEAAFKTVCPMINPHSVVVTNLFRDQLDRFGEITHTRNNIIMGLASSPESIVILNADDSLSYSIHDDIINKTILFGLNSAPYGDDENFLSDAPYCIKCKSPYQYEYRTYAHLGKFSCAKCGYSRVEPHIYAEEIELNTNSSTITISMEDEPKKATIALPGAYNIYNALSAAAAAKTIGISSKSIINAFNTFKSGFGRMEKLILDDVDLNVILVKNPAGLNQVINFLSNDKTTKTLVLILNDNFADGTDISWIWDVNFEKITTFSKYLDKIIVSGTRAEELKLRLKYAGFSDKDIILIKDYIMVIEKVITSNIEKTPVFILPTYTAMFDFRNTLSKKYKIRKFWK